jgi:hypothetical protein
MAEAIPHEGRGICGGIWHGERLSETRRKRSLAREMPERRAATTGSANCGSARIAHAGRQEISLMIKGIYNPAVVSESSGTFRVERH